MSRVDSRLIVMNIKAKSKLPIYFQQSAKVWGRFSRFNSGYRRMRNTTEICQFSL